MYAPQTMDDSEREEYVDHITQSIGYSVFVINRELDILWDEMGVPKFMRRLLVFLSRFIH
jgi:hypothetical protein